MPEIGQTLSHFKLVEKIGQGGMGEVYLADDTTLDRKVALKFLPEMFTSDPERMARFEREAKLLASLNHPNIAGIHGLEQADGNRFLVLEYVEGETLQARLNKGALPLEDALALCRQIAEGLEAAHEKGVIHRDLKPANVMITADEKVKILDFGLAKAFSDETQGIDSSQSPTLTLTETMTRPGVILGTAAYMSPEQAKGKNVDKRADIWAFGCILYECLTRKKVFEGETVTETLAAVLDNEPDWRALPHTVPHGIRFVLQRCLSKDASKRLHHAADVRIQMEDIREAPAPAKSRWAARTVAMAGILAAAWLAFVHFRDEPAPAIPLIRAEIPLPDNVDLVNESPFLLSPDGRYLAFIARDYGGMEHIWIRALDSSEARPMLETESDHISSIFWSPDSRFIAYDSGGKLKKIDIMGGPPRELCDIPPNAWGGSWNRQGTIVFMAAGNLMGVSEEGGDAYPVTDLNVTELKPPDVRRWVSSLNLDNPTLQRTSADFLPVLLPDGRHFLYYHSSENPEKGEVCLGTFKSVPDAPDPEPLVTDTLGFVYMPSPDAGPGFLLFLRGQTLMAQLFDEKQLKLLGVALPVADKVGSIVNRCFFSASSNGVLVYRSGIASPLTQTTLFDRQGKKIGKVGESGNFYGMAFSPNGEQVALGWDPEPLTTAITADIWIFNLLSGYRSQLTFKALNATPLWSHDGTRIVFGSSRDRTHMALYQKLVQEPKREELLLEHGNIPTSWSSDGRFLLFSRRDPETKSDLWVLPMEGDHKEEPLRVLPAENDEMDGRFSPDMRWIAYVSDEEDRYEVYVRKFSPHSAAKATEFGARWKVSQEGGMGPRWHRDSKELYYRSPDGSVMAVEITDDPAFPAGKPRTLFPAPRVWSQYIAFPAFVTWDVSTDGNRFLLPVPTEETAPVPFTLVLNWTSLLKK